MRSLLIMAMLGCSPKEVPPHLRPGPPTPAPRGVSSVPSSILEAADMLVARDPLVRRAVPGPLGWDGALEAPELEAWDALARSDSATAADWHGLDQRWPGTVAVPLARGARLAGAEVAIAQRDPASMALLAWAVPVAAQETILPAHARPPLHWLGPGSSPPERALLRVLEREVLLGWLDGPGVPGSAAAQAMQSGVHDRLTDSPTGRLLVARARDARAPERAAHGRAALQQASRLALLGAAADRDREQRAQAAEVESARVDEKDLDPVARLLTDAAEALTADAGDPESVGGALVALTAARLLGTCPDSPCAGLDRVRTLAAAERWGSSEEASLWRVIAWKRALDRLEVARERPSLSQALVDLADVLRGTGEAPVSARVLLSSRPDPALWLEVTRAAGGADGTTWEDARMALAARLASACDAALAHPRPEDVAEALRRIQRRARLDPTPDP